MTLALTLRALGSASLGRWVLPFDPEESPELLAWGWRARGLLRGTSHSPGGKRLTWEEVGGGRKCARGSRWMAWVQRRERTPRLGRKLTSPVMEPTARVAACWTRHEPEGGGQRSRGGPRSILQEGSVGGPNLSQRPETHPLPPGCQLLRCGQCHRHDPLPDRGGRADHLGDGRFGAESPVALGLKPKAVFDASLPRFSWEHEC